MARELIVYDPLTGRMVRINAPQYPPPAQQFEPQCEQYPAPYQPQYLQPYRPQYPARYRGRKRTFSRKRETRARRIAGLFGLFIASWIPTAFGWPGLTLLIWGGAFSYMLYRWLR